MTEKEVYNIAPGIYEVLWKDGGSSLASVGMDSHGGKWLAPINWIRPAEHDDKWWKKVEFLSSKVCR